LSLPLVYDTCHCQVCQKNPVDEKPPSEETLSAATLFQITAVSDSGSENILIWFIFVRE
jgi:hypothetical protein